MVGVRLEHNVVFESNGWLVRKRVVMGFSHRMATTLYGNLPATMQNTLSEASWNSLLI